MEKNFAALQATMGDRESYLAAGMDDYLAKPVRIKGLGQVLSKFTQEITR